MPYPNVYEPRPTREAKPLTEEEQKRLESEFIAGVDEATALSQRKNKEPQSRPEPVFRDVSRAIILDRLREFEKLSNSLFEPLQVEALHEMRIAAKRLRYAVELFQPCWPRSIATVAKRAARMQTALGDLHDCDVWIETLGKQMFRARKLPRAPLTDRSSIFSTAPKSAAMAAPIKSAAASSKSILPLRTGRSRPRPSS